MVVGGFLRAGTGGGNLGWTPVNVPPNEREGLPEEREGVLEEIEGALDGAGGVLMVVPRCSLDLGAVGGGARTSPELNFVSFSPSSGELEEGGCWQYVEAAVIGYFVLSGLDHCSVNEISLWLISAPSF